jgi:serine/threonine protein kinase/Tol biopolymer transport system component
VDDAGKPEELIFKAAIQLQERAEQKAYILKACGEDKVLLANVRSLLKYHVDTSFLDVPIFDAGVNSDDAICVEAPGTVIGRYKLMETIGEGGMAVVYRAEQQEPMCRQVALKIIKLGMDTKQVITRFKAERQALAILDHPNIARIYDGGATAKGRPYFVMELVQGSSITAYCKQVSASITDRLELFVLVCNAVYHAHKTGIIHRDIKPMNVLINVQADRPIPKVIDFGIAKAIQYGCTEDTLFTKHGQLIGTPAYMSPEQAGSTGNDVDQGTDIYSLGILLYELLTGTTPLVSQQFQDLPYHEICRMIRDTDPPRPSTRLSTLGEGLMEVAHGQRVHPDQLCRMIRGDLDWIVMKALEKERRRRYESVQDLAQDIRRHLRQEPVQARPPSSSYRMSRFALRHRGGLLTAALVCTALTLGATTAHFIGFPFGHGVPEHAPGMVQRHLWNTPSLSTFTPGISSDGRYLPYLDWTAGNLAIRDLVAETSWLVTKNTDATWRTVDGWAESAAISPDGNRIAYVWCLNDGIDSYQLRSADLDGSKVRILYQGTAAFWIGVHAWTPDGTYVLAITLDAKRPSQEEMSQATRTANLILVSTTDNAVKKLQTWHNRGKPLLAAFSPDGRFVAYDLQQEDDPANRDVFLLDIQTNSETTIIEHAGDDRLAGWTPDGRNLVFTSDRGTKIGLWMIAVSAGIPEGAPRQLIGQFEGSPVGFAVDGSYYYSTPTTAENVYVGTLDTTGVQFEAEPRLSTTQHVGSAMMADWSPDGQRLAYRCDLSGRRHNAFGQGDWAIVLHSIETGQEQVLSASPRFMPGTRMRGPWWSPKGDSVLVSAVSSDGEQGLYTIGIDTGQATLVKQGRIFDAAWSPDGDSITYVVHEKGLRRVELASGKSQVLYEGGRFSYVIDLSPDGQRLAFWQGKMSLRVMPAAGGEPREIVRLNRLRSSNQLQFVAWHPDGEHLFYADGDQLQKIHVTTGQEQTINATMSHLIHVALHPDGTHMALTMEQGGHELWVMENFLPE